jgi:hypothetical protein
MKKLLIVLSFLAVYGSAEAKNWSQIYSDIQYKIGDSTATVSNSKWTKSELLIRANDIQQFIAKTTHCLYIQELSTPTVNVREYIKPTNCISIDRVSLIQNSSTTAYNQYKKLTYVTMGNLDRDFPSWEQNTSGLPLRYYIRGDKVGFDRPFSAVYCSTGAIKIDYFKYPADMSADIDEPFDGVDYLQIYSNIIALGVAYKCKQDENKWAESATLQSEYVSDINLMIDTLNFNSDNTVTHITIGK